MRFAMFFLSVAAPLMGCGINPNALRVASEYDGRWAVSVSSQDCAIEESLIVQVSGQAFGVRVPNSGIFLSGVIRDGTVATEYSVEKSPLSKESTETEIAEILTVVNPSGAATGTWRSSKCSGELVMTKFGES